MTVDEIYNILASTSSSDWVMSEELDADTYYTYKKDALLRIKKRPINYREDTFKGEEWATTMHEGTCAYKVFCDVYYGESRIVTKMLVAVDGCRAILPMPKHGTKEISYWDYAFAKIVAPGGLDEYIKRSGLTVSMQE